MPDDNDLQHSPEEIFEDDRPMSDEQRARLDTLSYQTGEPTPDDHLTRSEADHTIEELKQEALAHDETIVDDLDEP